MPEPEVKNVLQTKFVHVAMLVRDLDKAMRDYTALLGLGPYRVLEVEGARAAFAALGPTQIELVQPVGKDHPHWKLLGDRDVCLHHFGFHIPDLNAELARFQKLGIGIIRRDEVPRARFAFLDTEKIAGVSFELVQRLQEPQPG